MSKKLEVFLVVILVLSLGFLRFYNLGHSEYIPDETTVITPLKNVGELFSTKFLLNQRKGPLQFVIAYIPFLFNKNIFNEGIFRIPFALANSLSVLFFYLFIRNISGRNLVALVATFLLFVNGLLVGLGRIVQYQSLNLLFSSIALYCYSLMLGRSARHRMWANLELDSGEAPDDAGDGFLLRNSLLGTLFCCLSLLSHWDAVFYFPIIFWIFGKFIIDRNNSKELKIKIVVSNLLLSCLILGPFLIPYLKNLSGNENNLQYFSTRIGVNEKTNTVLEKLVEYKFKTKLYNPFIYFWFILGTALLSFPEMFKCYGSSLRPHYTHVPLITFWFLINLGVFLLFFRHAGTHLYNLFIPLTILSGFGITSLADLFKKWWKLVIVIPVTIILAFFFYQSFLIFADIKVEYPFKRETILGYKTKKYTHKDLPNNVIGFPIRRGWGQISDYMKELGYPRYITNENHSISNFYIGDYYGRGDGDYYAIGVKYPLSSVTDYKFTQIKGKHTVKEIKVNGITTAKIYLVDGEK